MLLAFRRQLRLRREGRRARPAPADRRPARKPGDEAAPKEPDGRHRAERRTGLPLRARGDAAALKAAVEKRPHHVDLDDIGYALVERGLIDAAKHYFGLQYEMEDEDEPKGAWIAEKLKDAISTLR